MPPDDPTPSATSATAAAGEERFWDLTEPLLARPEVTRSTMMGFPCVRVNGQFFASTDHRTGDLLVKLPEDRVGELVGAGRAHSFASAGRTFREWAAVPYERSRSWKGLVAEALDFVATLPPKAPSKRKAPR